MIGSRILLEKLSSTDDADAVVTKEKEVINGLQIQKDNSD
jgi:hypothetical protein